MEFKNGRGGLFDSSSEDPTKPGHRSESQNSGVTPSHWPSLVSSGFRASLVAGVTTWLAHTGKLGGSEVVVILSSLAVGAAIPALWRRVKG